MEKIMYIGVKEIGGLNSISKLSNSSEFLDFLEPIDFHFILFSSLYQSGTNYFQLNTSALPSNLLNNPFWKDKFIDIDHKMFDKAYAKSSNIMNANFDFELDKKYTAQQAVLFQDYFTSLFYATDAGIPFVNPDYADSKNFDYLESRLSKELFAAIKSFTSLIQKNDISTITPQYSVLKKDVRRFEDIVESSLYLNYQNSLILLENDTHKIETIKKDIQVNALKLYHKYANTLDIKNMGFSFLKTNKKIADLFLNKPSSIFGDFIIDTLEKVATSNKKINYYKVDEANFMLLWAKRIGELMQKSQKAKLEEFLKEQRKNSH
jgi:ribosomal protein L25 (general stress protein Ctc)